MRHLLIPALLVSNCLGAVLLAISEHQILRLFGILIVGAALAFAVLATGLALSVALPRTITMNSRKRKQNNVR